MSLHKGIYVFWLAVTFEGMRQLLVELDDWLTEQGITA